MSTQDAQDAQPTHEAQSARATSHISGTPDLGDVDLADVHGSSGGREGCLRAMLRLSGTQHFCIVHFWRTWDRLSTRQQSRVWNLIHELYLNDQEALRTYIYTFL